MISDYLEIDDKRKVASWIELLSLISNDDYSRNDLLAKLGQENSYDETANDDVFSIIQQRIENYGETSPISIDDEILKSGSWENNLIYAFCLISEVIDYRTLSSDSDSAEKMFELLSLSILKEYINTTEGINLGHPNDNFKENLTNFSEQSKRTFVETINGGLPNPFLKNKNDNGVDNIVWKSLDLRNNQLLILNQATIGNFYSKKKKINLGSWQKIITFNSEECVLCLTFPKYIEKQEVIDSESYQYGLMFDRGRLVHFSLEESDLKTRIYDFCKRMIGTYLDI